MLKIQCIKWNIFQHVRLIINVSITLISSLSIKNEMFWIIETAKNNNNNNNTESNLKKARELCLDSGVFMNDSCQ